MLEAIVQIKLNRVAWSKARLSWGAGLAPLRERARRSLVVDAGAAADVGDGDTKSGLQIQWTWVVIGGNDVGDGNTESGSPVETKALLVILPAGNSKHQLGPILVATNLKIVIRNSTAGTTFSSAPNIHDENGENLNNTSLGSERPLVLLPCRDSLSSSRLRVREGKT